MNEFYKDYGEYLGEIFPGIKVQKISVNAGFTCPNRDGTIGRGGCIYCDNSSFTPSYCFGQKSVRDQIEAGKRFFSRKYPEMKYLAYFQSYTNTFPAEGVESLRRLYEEAMECEDVTGIIVGTRPDCLPEEVIRMLAQLNRRMPVIVELGAETSHDETLRLINRGHTFAQTADAVRRLADAGLRVGLHLICGLPGEDTDMILQTVEKCCRLPIESIKFHHLQVIEGTALHRLSEAGEIEVKPFLQDDYIELCVRLVNIVPRSIAIERFLASSPPSKVVAPKWGIKNYEFTNLLINKLRQLR